jgi:aquaporin Z
MGQLWLFWFAPILGALLAGWVYRNFLDSYRSTDFEPSATGGR